MAISGGCLNAPSACYIQQDAECSRWAERPEPRSSKNLLADLSAANVFLDKLPLISPCNPFLALLTGNSVQVRVLVVLGVATRHAVARSVPVLGRAARPGRPRPAVPADQTRRVGSRPGRGALYLASNQDPPSTRFVCPPHRHQPHWPVCVPYGLVTR